MARALVLLAALLVACSSVVWNASAFQMPSPVADAKGVRADVKYIACEACEALAKHASETISKLREEKKKEAESKAKSSTTTSTSSPSSSSSSSSSRFKKPPPAAGALTEAEILDAVEKMADPDSDHGEWITRYDLVVEGSRLRLKDMGQRGKCGAKCRTVAMAAADALDGTDTDLAEKLWKGGAEVEEPAKLAAWLCKEATRLCSASGSSVALPAGYALSDDAAFEPESAEEAQIRTMMASMKAQGMGGQMFDRKSVLKSLKEDDEDDDDDDDGGDVEVGENEEAEKKAEADAAAQKALEELEEEEEQKKKKEEEKEVAPSSTPSSTSAAEAAEAAAGKAAAVAGKGLAAAKGWLSVKKEALLSKAAAAVSSSAKKSTAEL